MNSMSSPGKQNIYERIVRAAQRGKGLTLSKEDVMVLYLNEDIRALGKSYENVS